MPPSTPTQPGSGPASWRARVLLDGLVPNWMALAQPTLLMLFAIFCFIAEVWRQLFEVEPEARDIDRLSGWLLIEVNGFLT